jgi:WD40 repeat protein
LVIILKVLSNGNIASGAANGDTAIKIWSTSLGTLLTTLIGHSNDVLVIDQLSNGNLISGSADTYTIIWDLTSANKLNKFRPITSTTAVNCLKQLPDDRIAFAGGNSQAIHTWEITGTNSETKIDTTTNIISTTPCNDMILYNSSYIAVASSGKATYLVDVTDTSNLQLSVNLSLVYSTQSMCLETQGKNFNC